MATNLDLRQLAIDRDGTSPPPRRRRAILARYVLPGVVLLGFAAMLGWAARDRFLPSKPITVVPVVVSRAEVQQSGTPLFQAAGWVEPRPTTVLVSALAEGVIEELLVVEGQEVNAGEPVARLIDIDARLILEQARADIRLRQAERASAQADLKAARMRLEHPVHLEAALADAESVLAKTETELARIPFLIRSAEARVEYAQYSLSSRQRAGDAVAVISLRQAQGEHDAALADLNELHARSSRLQREVEALRKKADALAKRLELLIDERRQTADAEARLQAAEARVRQAELAVETAQLQLDRMVVRAPRAGRVLDLIARPGTRVTGLRPGSEQGANTVVTLYDPQLLQVRADVRLEDVPLVVPGQPVRIETASSKQPIRGQVLYATSAANIQKNTLEVKIALAEPPPTIRPEMLVTATFLAPERPERERKESESQQRLLAPRELIESDGDVQTVWVADASGTARRQTVRLGRAGTEELVEVVEGLNPTDKLIAGGREGLSEGERILIRGEAR